MLLVDHLFILLLFVIQPIFGTLNYHRYMRKIKAGEPADRIGIYRETLAVEWLAFAALGATWIYFGRDFNALGFVAPGGQNFWIGLALVVAACAYLVYAWQKARSMTAAEREEQRNALGDLAHLLPRSKREFRSFCGISVTAGIVEETIYRGFVFWYLAQVLPIWAVVLVSSLVFGLGHSYQGAGGVVRVTLIGIAAGALYLYTGSIWLPIVAHAVLDILQGAMAVEILKDHNSHSGNSSSSSGSTIETTPERSGVSPGSGSPSSGSV